MGLTPPASLTPASSLPVSVFFPLSNAFVTPYEYRSSSGLFFRSLLRWDATTILPEGSILQGDASSMISLDSIDSAVDDDRDAYLGRIMANIASPTGETSDIALEVMVRLDVRDVSQHFNNFLFKVVVFPNCSHTRRLSLASGRTRLDW